MINVRVKVDMGDTMKRLRTLVIPGGTDKRRVLRAAGDRLLRITWENFGASGAHRPSEWAELSKRYQKQIGYFGPPKLILYGDLISSIMRTGEGDGFVEVGTENHYASDHQYGIPGRLPARPFFPVEGPADIPRLTQYAETEVVAAADREITAILGQ